jgi:hypothetical protein
MAVAQGSRRALGESMKTNAHSREQRCPACGGLFTISAGRRKKVQCPQCREVVTLDDFAPSIERKNNPVAEADLAANPERIAAWESLRSRIETLEQQVEALMVASRERSPLLPERVENSDSAATQAGAGLDAATKEPRRNGSAADSTVPTHVENGKMDEEAILARFQRAGEGALCVVAGDRAAWEVANALSEVLATAGWTMGGIVEDAALSRGCRGLTLSIGPAVPIRRVTRTLEALRKAGYGLTFQIDPERTSSEAILIVGSGSAPDK